MHVTETGDQVAAVRRFMRFFTQRIGVLQEGYLDSPYSLTEGRLLYELANRQQPTASELCKDLGLDAGYVSRVLRRFEKHGLLKRKPSDADNRQSLLALTHKGRSAFAPLNSRSREDVSAMLVNLAPSDRARLVIALQTVERVLGAPAETTTPFVLRPPAPGDMGWVVTTHGVLYAREYGFDAQFEALVAEIVAGFVQNFDASGERCWIAERNGENVGSIFIVRQSATIAKLRLLIVDPKTRGLGIGVALVEACLAFAKAAGYRKITLWTQSDLTAARAIYARAGFRLVKCEPHHSFGQDLTGEYWERKL